MPRFILFSLLVICLVWALALFLLQKVDTALDSPQSLPKKESVLEYVKRREQEIAQEMQEEEGEEDDHEEEFESDEFSSP